MIVKIGETMINNKEYTKILNNKQWCNEGTRNGTRNLKKGGNN